MGPTYLVLLCSAHDSPNPTALVLYRGTDEAEAVRAYDNGVRMESERASFIAAVSRATIYLTTVRAEAKLS